MTREDNTSVLAQQSVHLGLLKSERKKRGRNKEEIAEDQTPSKKSREDRGTVSEEEECVIVRDMERWCLECVMSPCVCILNTVKLKIVEEKIRRLSSRTTPTHNKPQNTTEEPRTTTSGAPQPPSTTTSSNCEGEDLGKVARVFTPRGQGCRDEGRDLSVVKKTLSSTKKVSVTRKTLKGEECDNLTTTTTPRKLATRMKVKNNSRKKIVKMTEDEEEKMKKTTKDIRGFFIKKATSTGEEETVTAPSSFRELLRLAERRSTADTDKVSPHKIKTNLNIPRKPGGGRCPDAGLAGKDQTVQGGPSPGDGGARRGGAAESCIRVMRAMYGDGTRDMRALCDLGGGTEHVKKSIADDNSVVCSGVDNMQSLQFCNKPDKPGPRHDEQGGGAACGDGGDKDGVGSGRRLLPHHKTKPNVKEGGLSARILLWEMKSNIGNENCTESTAAPDTSRKFGDRK